MLKGLKVVEAQLKALNIPFFMLEVRTFKPDPTFFFQILAPLSGVNVNNVFTVHVKEGEYY